MSKITLDELAAMIAKQFNAIDKRFDIIESDITGIKGDVRDLKTGQKRLEDSIWEMRSELNDIKKRIERIEKRTLESLPPTRSGDDDVMVSEIVALKKRVLILETKLNKSP